MREIKKVSTPEEIKLTAALAYKIWTAHYTPIIGREQVDYMLENFQSEKAVSSQLKEGYEYYLLLVDGTPAGYLGLVPDKDAGKMMISKIYISSDFRGGGHGEALINFTRGLAESRGMQKIWLTVNKNNDSSVNWYKKRGFSVIDEVKADIGNGFYMDDFIMEMPL